MAPESQTQPARAPFRLNEPVATYLPPTMREALAHAAHQEMLSVSTYIKRVLKAQLVATGLLER
jgi:hypothetical protein